MKTGWIWLFCCISLLQATEGLERIFAGFSSEERSKLEALFESYTIQPKVLDLMSRPTEKLNWKSYQQRVVTQQRIQQGQKFLKENKELLEDLYARYGVPPRVLVALVGIETSYGQRTGSWKVGDALKTLALSNSTRSAFFAKELRTFLELVLNGKVPADLTGSYAGAFGCSQFMPSSYQSYARPFREGRSPDLMMMEDALTSAAHYLSSYGWKASSPIAAHVESSQVAHLAKAQKNNPKPAYEPSMMAPSASDKFSLLDLDEDDFWIGYHNFYVLTRYNHSTVYGMAIVNLSEALRSDECVLFGLLP